MDGGNRRRSKRAPRRIAMIAAAESNEATAAGLLNGQLKGGVVGLGAGGEEIGTVSILPVPLGDLVGQPHLLLLDVLAVHHVCA